MPLLDIHNLTVEFKTGSGWFRAVDGFRQTSAPNAGRS